MKIKGLLIFIFFIIFLSCNFDGAGVFENKDLESKIALTAKPVSSGMIQLQWKYSGPGVNGFLIERISVSNSREYVTALHNTFSIYNDTGLELDKEYTYIVSAYKKSNIVTSSDKVSARTKTIPDNCHYIRSDATGSNNGNNWNNAWIELPDELQRGHTYFIADGVYPPYHFNDEETGSEFIYIKKAVPQNHGDDTEWVNSYGDGQAVFFTPSGNNTDVIIVSSGYWEIDGQTGENKSGHGFKIYTEQEGLTYLMIVMDYSWSNRMFSYINVRHCEMEHTGADNSAGAGKGFQIHSLAGLKNSILQYCYIHDIPGMNIYLTLAESCIIEHNYCSRNRSDPVYHGEGIQCNEKTKNIIVRYNTWEDIEGTAVIVATSGWEIYGNAAYHTPDYPNTGQYGAGISAFVFSGGTEDFPTTDNTIVHNTVCNINLNASTTANAGVGFGANYKPARNKVFNNLWVNCAQINFYGIDSISNNYYTKDPDNPNVQDLPANVGDNAQITEVLPFVSENNLNLNQQTEPGLDLGYPYCYDKDGNLRGQDGIWTRGAYEY